MTAWSASIPTADTEKPVPFLSTPLYWTHWPCSVYGACSFQVLLRHYSTSVRKTMQACWQRQASPDRNRHGKFQQQEASIIKVCESRVFVVTKWIHTWPMGSVCHGVVWTRKAHPFAVHPYRILDSYVYFYNKTKNVLKLQSEGYSFLLIPSLAEKFPQYRLSPLILWEEAGWTTLSRLWKKWSNTRIVYRQNGGGLASDLCLASITLW